MGRKKFKSNKQTFWYSYILVHTVQGKNILRNNYQFPVEIPYHLHVCFNLTSSMLIQTLYGQI